MFSIVNIYVIINNFSFKYVCVVRYLKLRFYCLTCSFTDFRDFNSENRDAACVSKQGEYEKGSK